MKSMAITALMAFGVGFAASAQQSSPPPRGGDRTDQVSFETVDKDKDGKLTRTEANMIDGFDFSRADTNADATLSRQEFQAAMATSSPRGDGRPNPGDDVRR